MYKSYLFTLSSSWHRINGKTADFSAELGPCKDLKQLGSHPLNIVYPLLLVLPFGAAAQNLFVTLTLFVCLGIFAKRRINLSKDRLTRNLLLCASGFLASLLLAESLGDSPDYSEGISHVVGYLFWALFPVVFYHMDNRFDEPHRARIVKIFSGICTFFGLVSVSQMIFGWKLAGTSLVFGFHRAQGFYSHPLTFAYVCLLLWVPMQRLFLAKPREPLYILGFLGVGLAIYASASRTVQIVALGILLWNLFFLLKGPKRTVALGVVGLSLLCLVIFDNPVKTKFVSTIQGTEDRQSAYPDDRVAFWHAHFEMIKEKPFFGHGVDTGGSFRKPYYERIGLGEFSKKYEAHNQYIQVLTNSGILGLIFVLLWATQLLKICWAAPGVLSSSVVQGLLVFGIAGLTQNALQDMEVRFALTLIACLGVYGYSYQPKN